MTGFSRPYRYDLSTELQMRVMLDARSRLRVPNSRPVAIGLAGVKALRLVALICKAQSSGDADWAIKSRWAIRRIRTKDINCRKGVRRAFKVLIERTRSDQVRQIAIWLRGRCGGCVGTDAIGQFRYHSDVRMRKVVTIALRQMHAWHYLREIAEHDPDTNIRRLAAQNRPEEYANRLAQFMTNVSGNPNDRSPTKRLRLRLAESVKLKASNLPKSIELIRHYLKRIRHTLAKN